MSRVILSILLLASLLLAGCNCLSGFGRDLQKTGEWIEERAKPNS